MKLKTLFSLFLISLGAMVTLLSVALIRITGLQESGAHEIAMTAESIRITEEIQGNLLKHNRNAFQDVLMGKPLRLESRASARNQTNKHLDSIEEFISSPEEAQLVEKVRKKLRDYFRWRDGLEAEHLPQHEQYRLMAKAVDDIEILTNQLIEMNISQARHTQTRVLEQNREADILATILGTTSLLILIAGTAIIVRYVLHPMVQFKNTILKYGSGKTNVRAKPTGLKEIKDIAATFNSMADLLEEKRQNQLRFVSSIAHDLRNPLNAISMASDMLQQDGGKQDVAFAQIISRQIKHLDRLVGDLLDTTRIEAGQLSLKSSLADVNKLVKDTAKLYKTDSQLHPIILDLPTQPIKSQVDPDRVTQVVHNLLSNAIKYSPNGGKVSIRLTNSSDNMLISVSDEGMGISPEDLDNIFKPFNRSKATAGTIPGIGLGLSASRKIVEAHGGTLKVKSILGKGSVFTVSIPLRGLAADSRRVKQPLSHAPRAELSA